MSKSFKTKYNTNNIINVINAGTNSFKVNSTMKKHNTVISKYGYDIKESKVKLNVNLKIVELFNILRMYHLRHKELYQAKAYTNAISKINTLNYDINTSNVRSLLVNKIVGKKLYDKIVEYLQTGKIASVEETLAKEIKYPLLEIKGFGKSTVEHLAKQGIKTPEDLIKSQYYQLLTHLQQLGLKYRFDLAEKIPREEVTVLFEYLNKYVFSDTGIEKFKLSGSYRRNLPFSKDMDIVIGVPSNMPMFIHDTVIEKIKNLHTYLDTVREGEHKYSFLMKSIVSNKARQVDIVFIPEESFVTAVFYLTGSNSFNERIRGISKRKGIKLNEYGLTINGKIIHPSSEREIFDIIGIEYLSPEKRIATNVKFV